MDGEGGDYGPSLDQAWGPEDFPNLDGTTANNGPGVQTQSVFDQSTDSQGSDAWAGVWGTVGKALNTGMNYYVAKDAAKSGLVPGYAANGQPVYTRQLTPVAQQKPFASTGSVLLIAGGIALVVVLAKKG